MPNFEHTNALLDSFLEAGVPGYDFELRRHGEVLLRRYAGFSNREKQIPMNGKERYYIYSCSKPITCAAALQLWERGLFRLEDELCEYMPEFAEMKVRTPEGGTVPARKRITIFNLFTMTAGFNSTSTRPRSSAAGMPPTARCRPANASASSPKNPSTSSRAPTGSTVSATTSSRHSSR